MDRDIRQTDVFRETCRLFEEIYRPGEGFISDIKDIQLSSHPSRLLFTGTVVESLDSPLNTYIYEFDLETSSIKRLTFGPNRDSNARISPDGRIVAFISDRERAFDFQLCFIDLETQTLMSGPKVDGWVEHLQWSPDGRRILLGVAGHGAELPSGRGAYKTAELIVDEPSWMPRVSGASSEALSRKIGVFDVANRTLTFAGGGDENVWEATWCGNDRLVVITSRDPQEGAWYSAELSVIDLPSGSTTKLYKPTHQIALPRASPAGRYVAFVEAISSDREYVAGNLILYDMISGGCSVLDARSIDVTYIEWRSDDCMLVAGHRGLETVVSNIDVKALTVNELWTGINVTTSGSYATVLGLKNKEDFAFICESFFHRPQIATVRAGRYELAKTNQEPEQNDDNGAVESIRWQAPDGLQIEGWLLRPKSKPPYATVLDVHGGPVLHWRPYWLGRAASVWMLLRRGYAVFLPNPRGSSGRGQEFAAHVVGDVGGADTGDYLSGLDHLINSGISHPSRLGVTGLSYGGFMTCWLTTQDARFGAAVSVAPATNHVSQHLLCNIPQFVSLFLQDHYTNLEGKYYARSPILQAHKSSTPTLLICGELDRCTPAAEAFQFNSALLENGVESVVASYPEEGHGIAGIPAAIDFAARCVIWFERYIPARIDGALA